MVSQVLRVYLLLNICFTFSVWRRRCALITLRGQPHRIPEAGVTGFCDLPDMGAEYQTQVLCKSSVCLLLATGLSFQL